MTSQTSRFRLAILVLTTSAMTAPAQNDDPPPAQSPDSATLAAIREKLSALREKLKHLSDRPGLAIALPGVEVYLIHPLKESVWLPHPATGNGFGSPPVTGRSRVPA